MIFKPYSIATVCALLMTTISLHAQVEIDKPIDLTGGSGERAVRNLETPVNGTDAVNKDYVDNAISALNGGSFTYSVIPGRSSIQFVEMEGYSDTTRVEVKRLTGPTGVVTLTASGFPAGIAWDFYSGGGYVSYRSILQMTRVSSITPGTYTITITATGGGNTVVETFDLSVVVGKRVFVTSTTYTGNLGGLSGADNICQTRANAGSLGGTWKAWLSTTGTSAASRLNQSSGPYFNLDGSVVANNFSDLLDGYLTNHIRKTELNTSPPTTWSGYTAVWSNTKADGTSGTSDCSSWGGTSGSSEAGLSYISASINEWTRWTGVQCNVPLSLYCFEQ